MLKDTIKEYEDHRISESEYLLRAEKIMDSVVAHKDASFPEEVNNNDVAKAIYGITKEFIGDKNLTPKVTKQICIFIALEADNIFKSSKIVNWQNNADIIKQMKIQIFDMAYDEVKMKYNLDISITDIDLFAEKCI
jgi:type I restriction enzyme R subunit